jgi:type VI secretion system protein ImpH
MRDFFDLFNHRTISHFYRAWEKYRLPIAFEQTQLDQHGRAGDDKFTKCLYAYVGLGTPGLRNRLDLPDAAFLFFAGQFAHRPRNAVSLESMIGDFFEVATQVVQFVGQWLYLESADQSSLRARSPRSTHNNVLGQNVVVGRRVWGIENRFRVRLGPMPYRQFFQYLPTNAQLQRLAQFVRTYAGPEYDFDVQLVLRRDEVPMCQLGGDSFSTARLGWNTWLHNQPFANHADDATFVVEGSPTGT